MLIEISPSHTISQPSPIRIETGNTALPDGALRLVSENGGASLSAQRDGEAILVLLAESEAGQTLRYRIEAADIEAADNSSDGVRLQEDASTLQMLLPQGLFGTYHFGSDVPRPFVWPLHGPGQIPVTRAFPMRQIEGEVTDHKHHRSLWTAYEEANDSNNWNEEEGHGFTRHEKFLQREEGPVFGGFTAQSTWTNKDRNPVLQETRALRLYNAGEDVRLFDYDLTFAATHGDVTFGETKEAGVLAIRVATSMDGSRGGLITNSQGGSGEAECWGKKAAWCDYSGRVGDEAIGITVFDHPQNPNFPTRWHVRDYGLFGTNPFSTASFNAGDPTPFVLKNGERTTFRYRVLIHRGDSREAKVIEHYDIYSEPPRCRVLAP